MFTKQQYGIIAAVALVVGGASFFGGTKFAEARGGRGQRGGMELRMAGPGGQGGNVTFRGGQGGMQAARGVAGFGGAVAGEILSADEKSITVKMPDGGSRIVFFGESVKVTRSVDGTVADMKAGEQVLVTGTPNADGSVTAQSVRLGEQPFMMTRGERGQQGGGVPAPGGKVDGSGGTWQAAEPRP